MEEKFIERGTSFPLEHGKLTVYETNCTCRNIQFYFDQYVITIMVSGHKTIVSENLKFEFFPGTLFIPEKESINHVAIPNASFNNPTKCLVLELNPSFIKSTYEELLYSEQSENFLYNRMPEFSKNYFLSNDQLLISAFIKLYSILTEDKSASKILVESLILKEILYRLFNTECIHLLKMNFEKKIYNGDIRKVVSYIKSNINKKITTESLAKIAGLGQTTFFKVFKKSIGKSPIDFILHERIRQSKVMIKKNKLSLQEIAFKCGFNSYEYFCSSFKKIENQKPTEFKRNMRVLIEIFP